MINNSLSTDVIKNRIFTIRGIQVMLDSDLAEMYCVSVKRLNEQVKRNIERFPEQFMFQLTDSEFNSLRFQIGTLENANFKSQTTTNSDDFLKPQNIAPGSSNSSRSQIATLEKGKGKNVKYLPYAFSEQGVAMLSGILKSDTAVRISIQIIEAFVSMRKFLSKNAEVFLRLDSVERKQLEFEIKTNANFDKVFDALQTEKHKQGIFFDGQIFDAYKFVSDLIRDAKESIALIDNYVDDTVLILFSKRKDKVEVVI